MLEVLINANEVGLEVSEIEGDAILFYKYGESPGLPALYQQVQKMFCEFHKRLIAYDQTKFCQCNACLSAIGLSLKVITHYGEFTGYTIKNFNKLIGKDVIVAHQLLKNDIDQHEYWLVTNSLTENEEPAGFAEEMKWDRSSKHTETGEVPFHYTQLGRLKEELEPDPPPQVELSDKVKLLSISKDYDAEIIHLFHATGDFHYRSRWQEGVRSVEEVSHFLPRVGMRFKRIQDNGQTVIYSSHYHFTPEKIQFGETDENKDHATHYIIEKTDDNKVRLTLDYYEPQKFAGKMLFDLFRKKKMERKFNRSLDNLERLVKEVRLPDDAFPRA